MRKIPLSGNSAFVSCVYALILCTLPTCAGDEPLEDSWTQTTINQWTPERIQSVEPSERGMPPGPWVNDSFLFGGSAGVHAGRSHVYGALTAVKPGVSALIGKHAVAQCPSCPSIEHPCLICANPWLTLLRHNSNCVSLLQ